MNCFFFCFLFVFLLLSGKGLCETQCQISGFQSRTKCFAIQKIKGRLDRCWMEARAAAWQAKCLPAGIASHMGASSSPILSSFHPAPSALCSWIHIGDPEEASGFEWAPLCLLKTFQIGRSLFSLSLFRKQWGRQWCGCSLRIGMANNNYFALYVYETMQLDFQLIFSLRLYWSHSVKA